MNLLIYIVASFVFFSEISLANTHTTCIEKLWINEECVLYEYKGRRVTPSELKMIFNLEKYHSEKEKNLRSDFPDLRIELGPFSVKELKLPAKNVDLLESSLIAQIERWYTAEKDRLSNLSRVLEKRVDNFKRQKSTLLNNVQDARMHVLLLAELSYLASQREEVTVDSFTVKTLKNTFLIGERIRYDNGETQENDVLFCDDEYCVSLIGLNVGDFYWSLSNLPEGNYFITPRTSQFTEERSLINQTDFPKKLALKAIANRGISNYQDFKFFEGYRVKGYDVVKTGSLIKIMPKTQGFKTDIISRMGKAIVGTAMVYTGVAVIGAGDCLVGRNKLGSCGSSDGNDLDKSNRTLALQRPQISATNIRFYCKFKCANGYIYDTEKDSMFNLIEVLSINKDAAQKEARQYALQICKEKNKGIAIHTFGVIFEAYNGIKCEGK